MKNKKTQTEYCFIITSVISFQKKELSYTKTRSVFTPEERFAQTIKTIESIREKVQGAIIVLVEAGISNKLLSELEKRVDQYVFLGDNLLVRKACDSRLKSFGEAIMLLTAIPRIKQRAEYYFKISGRYYLNEEFNLSFWKKEGFSFHYEYGNKDYVLTRLYGVDALFFKIWVFAFIRSIPLLLIDYAIESVILKHINKKHINSIEILGIQGYSATDGEDLSN